jgi:cobalt-zinc-cadmium efflux system protein
MHEHSRYEKLGWTIFLNSVITAAEYIGGVLSGSLALISDAGHNFTDVLSLILSCAGEKISLKKPDKKNSFGLKRFEILTALVNAASLWIIGF